MAVWMSIAVDVRPWETAAILFPCIIYSSRSLWTSLSITQGGVSSRQRAARWKKDSVELWALPAWQRPAKRAARKKTHLQIRCRHHAGLVYISSKTFACELIWVVLLFGLLFFVMMHAWLLGWSLYHEFIFFSIIRAGVHLYNRLHLSNDTCIYKHGGI